MYTPRAFAESDLAALDWLIAHDPFATLITLAGSEPFATHLPVLYSRDGERVLIEGHWAKPNPQVAHDANALLIVHGPHAYVSASWYPDKEAAARVPTWNYAVAHLHGRLEASTDHDFLAGIVERLSDEHEAKAGQDWRFERSRDEHARQLAGIVGFRFRPERIELKYKLSQNHPEPNRRAVIAALDAQSGDDARAIAALMRAREA